MNWELTVLLKTQNSEAPHPNMDIKIKISKDLQITIKSSENSKRNFSYSLAYLKLDSLGQCFKIPYACETGVINIFAFFFVSQRRTTKFWQLLKPDVQLKRLKIFNPFVLFLVQLICLFASILATTPPIFLQNGKGQVRILETLA